MKTFFIAFILGIFAGSLVTAYWSSPEAFEELKLAKNNLLSSESADTPEPSEEAVKVEAPADISGTVVVPMFKVATKEEVPEVEETKPEPVAPELTPEAETEAPPPPRNNDPDPKTNLEKGKEKAAEIAENTKEKAVELGEKAEPYLNDGVDLAIASAIRAQFKLDKRVNSDDLEITVKNREVILTGAVGSGEIKQLAIEIAMTTKGVLQVTPDIVILDTE